MKANLIDLSDLVYISHTDKPESKFQVPTTGVLRLLNKENK